jgi:hypothetical protein
MIIISWTRIASRRYKGRVYIVIWIEEFFDWMNTRVDDRSSTASRNPKEKRVIYSNLKLKEYYIDERALTRTASRNPKEKRVIYSNLKLNNFFIDERALTRTASRNPKEKELYRVIWNWIIFYWMNTRWYDIIIIDAHQQAPLRGIQKRKSYIE